MEDLNAPAYKIASFEVIDIPLIRYVAQTQKPLIISTGMANVEEIQEAIDAAQGAGCSELAILFCVSGYPAPVKAYNLQTLSDMQDKFGLVTGLSDHTLDNTTAIVSVGLGASIIEKHFTLDRNAGGPDDSFSLEANELKALCENSKIAWSSVGKVDYGKKSSEIGNLRFRRSLYVTKDLSRGDIITKDHIASIRPGYGLAPKHFVEILGRTAVCDIARGTPLTWDLLK